MLGPMVIRACSNIPNLVSPKGVILKSEQKSLKFRIDGKKQIGFLGRLHPIKNWKI